jgi:hypothetical protein
MFKRGSNTHSLLMVAKMLRKPFGESEITYILGVFDGPAKVKRSAKVLVDLGFLEECPGNKWIITNSGIEAVYANAMKSETHENR